MTAGTHGDELYALLREACEHGYCRGRGDQLSDDTALDSELRKSH